MKKLILALLISIPCYAQNPTVVQTAYLQTVEDIFVTDPTFTNPNTSGNLLLCFFSIGVDDPTGNAGIYDTAGNTWTMMVNEPRFIGSNTGQFEVWYAIANSFGGINTVHNHGYGGIPSWLEMYVLEISNVNQFTAFGYNHGNGTTSSATVNSITINAQLSIVHDWSAVAVELTKNGTNPFYIGFFDDAQNVTNNFTVSVGQIDYFAAANHNLTCVFGPPFSPSKKGRNKVFID